MARKPDKPFLVVNGEIEPFFEYRQPQKLNKCKYELVVLRHVRFSMTTERYNREDVLGRIIKIADGMPPQRVADNFIVPYYRVYLTENGVREILLDSRIHKSFIKKLR